MQAAVKTLRKAISRHQFYIQVSDTEYEVAQRPAKAPEGQGTCTTGQVLQDGKCSKSPPWPPDVHPANFPHLHGHVEQTAHAGDRGIRALPGRGARHSPSLSPRVLALDPGPSLPGPRRQRISKFPLRAG